MDSLITAAARALAAGDPFGALNRIALRGDAPALALRGIAMAQLGDFAKARLLVRSAARAFGPRQAMARARCVVAEAEIALASRDLAWPARSLEAARETLEDHGDAVNAAHARYLQIKRLLLVGRLDEAERELEKLDATALPPALRAAHELGVAGIAIRRVRARQARAAIVRASDAASEARIPALIAEVESARALLDAPAARLISMGHQQPLRLDDVEALLASKTLIVDACRYTVRQGTTAIPLSRRPVLFTLVRALAEAWPADASREALVARAFRGRHVDASHRVRLRVEMGRLRSSIARLAGVTATKGGFALVPRAKDVVVLAPPTDEPHAEVLAFLADGESWSSSALALALDESQRGVQRALEELARRGVVQPVGQGRARRWMMPPLAGFATTLLLPPPVTG